MSIRVRLTRKFAQILNGIDLSRTKTGEEIELSEQEADLLIAEGWATPLDVAHDKTKQRSRKSRRRPAEN